ncbi:hypothetical protein E4U14_003527 [Claviceps sp. LM454 group G7]|nr:hypothetical protein E4U14_003527 [Claviceps sp. LM454 group G7]
MKLHTLQQAAISILGWPIARATAQNRDESSLPPATNNHEVLSQEGTVVEWHRVSVTIQQLVQASMASPHQLEKERLLSVMARQNGVWSPNHPRYRLLDALHGFTKFYEWQRADVDRLRRLYVYVSKAQKKLLEDAVSYSSKFTKVEQNLASNQHLCDNIVQASLQYYDLDITELKKHIREREAEGAQPDGISVAQALKHIVRDWTEEGSRERDKTFACLRRTLEQFFPERNVGNEYVKVLLPGAGLGRLGHEVSRLGGFEVTINEWSMYANAVYRFLETQSTPSSQSFHPFADGWSHHATEENMHRALHFPDASINERDVLMVEGDFTTVFKAHSDHYDVVLTYFFIDTARNLLSYFDTIKDVLKKGGLWINLGPLLYGTSPVVQLSLEDILTVAEKMGFEFLETDAQCGEPTFDSKPTVRSIEASYTFDYKALTKNAYNAQFWVARKV